jgi:hypothetical protein
VDCGGWDADDSSFWSGLFSAHWQRPDNEFENGPESVSADEAIAWGRARADVILIRTGDSDHYSAGRRQPERQTLPKWPSETRLERRRPQALAYMDRTDGDEPIIWAITVKLSMPGVELGKFPAAFNAARRLGGRRALDPGR